MAKKLDIAQLKVFSPLDGLKTDNLHALLKKIEMHHVELGETLFKEGDTDKLTVYLLSGKIELKKDGDVVKTITSGTAATRIPLAPTLPRQVTAVATSAVDFIAIDSDLLDVMLTWDQTWKRLQLVRVLRLNVSLK